MKSNSGDGHNNIMNVLNATELCAHLKMVIG